MSPTTEFDASVERHDLRLSAPFGISRRTTEVRTVVTLELSVANRPDDSGCSGDDDSGGSGDDDSGGSGDDDSGGSGDEHEDRLVGIGAASPAAYYDEDADSVEAALPDLLDALRDVDDPLPAPRGQNADRDGANGTTLSAVEDRLREVRPDDPAARSTVSIALHDLAAKRLRLPLYQLWGLAPAATPSTSYSVGIADPETMAERAGAAVDRGHRHLKVKLGTDDDRARLAAVRAAAPDAAIRVDANGAWDRDTALERLHLLDAHDVELLEQPVPATDPDALRAVTEQTPIPVAADEACVDADDVPWLADACDVVVCKLVKCGGLAAARRQIAAARDHGLDVMLGCMVESSASIAAAWHLAPLADYADLDGAMLLAEDPYAGVPLVNGRAALGSQERPGTGARRQE